MRTTLTLDDDVAAEIDRLRRDRDTGLKEVVNEALRRGLREMQRPEKKRAPFRTRTFDGGEPLVRNLDNIAEVIALVEGEDYK
jgi:Arc/MetJ family transcription regulator